MPPKKPQSIFDVINQNIVTVSEDIHALMKQMDEMSARITAFEQIFNAPEQPNAHGEEGVGMRSSEQ